LAARKAWTCTSIRAVKVFPFLWLSIACSIVGACNPTSRAERNDAVIPTPPVLNEAAGADTRIGARALLIAYSGAKGAPSAVTRPKQDARDRARMVANIAQMSGEAFPELVIKYSDRPLLADNAAGTLLERGSGLLPAEAERAAFALAIGEVSAPIETAEGFVIVQRLETPAGGPLTIGGRHILIAYQNAQRAAPEITRTRDEARTLAQQVANEARSGKDWVALWKQHSNEPGGREGGDLGTFGRGQMVPAFEHAAFDLGVGEISDVVETPFGFHVIQRMK
jgi:peptidyl-prolyl cis-trans isomerase NIMA-interacting 1